MAPAQLWIRCHSSPTHAHCTIHTLSSHVSMCVLLTTESKFMRTSIACIPLNPNPHAYIYYYVCCLQSPDHDNTKVCIGHYGIYIL